MSFLKNRRCNKVLVVDDEVDVLDFLKIYLESLSWDVEIAATTDRAFELMSHEEFFCILTDIAMPDMDGYEFITEVKKRNYSSEPILMTGFGYNPNHSLVKLHKAFRCTCLFKPFNRSKLAEAVKNAYNTYHNIFDSK